MSYDILHNDRACVVINKPPNINVYNPPGRHDPSISSWWIKQPGVDKTGWRDKSRAGIVHRLDKDTSGALLLAKNQTVLAALQKQFAQGSTQKEYIGIVAGRPDKPSGEIVSYINRDAKRRTKRKSQYINFLNSNAKKAVTQYKLIRSSICHPREDGDLVIRTTNTDSRLRGNDNKNITTISTVLFNIKTGRTHQIRLHAKMLGTPILGDKDYSTKHSRAIGQKLGINRQLLHARALNFISPATQKRINITAPVPDDLGSLIKLIDIQ